MPTEPGVKALMREAVGFLSSLLEQEKKTKAVDNGPLLNECRCSRHDCNVLGAEKLLERLLNKSPKEQELAHVNMQAKLEAAGLKHYVTLPQLWPPTVAVSYCRCEVVCRGACLLRYANSHRG